MKNYNVHNVEWTNEKVAKFWDWSNSNENEYFAEQVGQEIIEIASKYFSKNSNIIDYGSGDGFLIRYLLKGNYGNISGCDFSSRSVYDVNEKFKNEPNFKNCIQLTELPSKINSNEFDCAFFLETIEHLLSEFLEPTIAELNRIIKIGGIVVLTTRNNEDLNKLQVHCPDCGAVFHRVQHVNTFTTFDVEKLMAKFGFEKIICKSTKLGADKGSSRLVNILRKGYRLIKPLPESSNVNLIYIGRKLTSC